MVRKTIISALIGAGILFAPIAADAVGLGKLSVMSGLGQPFRGEIDLLAVDRNEEGLLAARLATAEAFQIAKVERSSTLLSLRFSIEQKKSGQWFVKLISPTPINDPFLDMLVEINWPSGRLLREYTVLLDPPGLDAQKPVMPEGMGSSQSITHAETSQAVKAEADGSAAIGTAGAGTYGNLNAVYVDQPVQPGATGRPVPALEDTYENLGNFHLNLAIQAYEQAIKRNPSRHAMAEKLAAIRQIARTETALPSGYPLPSAKQARLKSIPAGADDDGAMIENVVAAWSDAWSRKDVESYLSYYGGDFIPEQGKSRVKWEKLRKARLTKPGPIEVKIANLSVEMRSAGLATARFTQRYRSANFHSADRKTLVLVNRDGRWFIRNENAGSNRPAKLVNRLEIAVVNRT
jgi:Tfp pilus assembly protein FimV